MAESTESTIEMSQLETDICTALELQQDHVIDLGICGEIVLTKKNSDDSKLVVKKFLLGTDRGIRNIESFFTEVKSMQTFNHPFIMKCSLACLCPGYLAICMDYFQTGTLQEYVGGVSLEISELCVTQTACALRYLHRNNVVHMDIKLDNIFLDSDFNAIVGDFGFAVEMAPEQKTLLTRQCSGTPCYFAPERIAAPLDKELDPFKLDSYCLGVVLWALVLERYPGDHINYYSEARRRRDLPANIRRWLLKLLDRCPSNRPTVTDFLATLRRDGAYRYVVDNN